MLTNVDQYMDSPEKLYRLIHSIFTRLLACDIRLNDFRNATFFIDHALCLLRPFDIEVDQRDFGAMSSK
jgi:hypothetical protein